MKRLSQTESPIFVILCVLCFPRQSFLTFILCIANYMKRLNQTEPPIFVILCLLCFQSQSFYFMYSKPDKRNITGPLYLSSFNSSRLRKLRYMLNSYIGVHCTNESPNDTGYST